MSRRGTPIQILVVGSSPPLVEGVATLLAKETDFVVEASAFDGDDDRLRTAQPRIQAAVAVLDAREVDAREPLARITTLAAVAPTVVLASFADRAQVSAVIGAGARACVATRTRTAGLLEAIRAVATGRGYLCPVAADLLVRSDGASSDGPAAPAVALTVRERQVLALVAKGRTNLQIATTLALSIKTVHTHRANLMRKLGVRNASMLVRAALRLGLIPPR